MAGEERLKKLGIALVVMLVLAVVGFTLYQAFTGKGEIGQAVVFGLLGLSALGLVRVFIFSSAQRALGAEDFILVIILIGFPLVMLFALEKLGFDLFSIIQVSKEGITFNIFNLKGNILDWIKQNLTIVSIALLVLFIWRDKVTNAIRRMF